MMRRTTLGAALSLALAVALAAPAWAAGYSISITSPGSGSVLTGTVGVHVSYTTQSEAPSEAAFQLQSGGAGWVDGAGTAMSHSGSGFSGSVDSTQLANATYTLIARAWGGGYDAGDPSSFAEASITVHVNNAPPVPSGLRASATDGGVTVAWDAVAGQDRSDFRGYEVYRAAPAGGGCPGIDAYAYRSTVMSPSYSENISSTYCYTVVASRTSPINGTISSDPSAPVRANKDGEVGGGSGDGGGGGGDGKGDGNGEAGPVSYLRRGSSGRAADAPLPQAPEVREPLPDDGTFDDRLPYSPMTVDDFNRILSQGTGVSADLSGVEGRHKAMTLVAAGLLLGVSAMQIRRFVSAP